MLENEEMLSWVFRDLGKYVLKKVQPPVPVRAQGVELFGATVCYQ
jgi:hypothetical protein